MKTKLLVFFGIVAVGSGISIFTLTKGRKDVGGGEVGLVATEPKNGTSGSPNSVEPPTTVTKVEASPTVPGNISQPANQPATVAEMKPGNSETPQKPETKSVPRDPAMTSSTPDNTKPTPNTPMVFEQNAKSPEGVLGGVANSLGGKNLEQFMAASKIESIPPEVRERLKAVVENPNLQLNPNRPFWEVAKTRDSVRWMLDFVPTKEGGEKPQSVIVDVTKSPTDVYSISDVSVPPTLQEVVDAIERPGSNPNVRIDSLNVAQAFSKAVTSEDFVSARKLCGEKVSDERIAGLMIALEEGKFTMREDRPLIVTFTRDSLSWILSRVSSPVHSSEYALELEKGQNWKVNGLTFGKVIAALARDVDGPYSPIVEDPAGGDSLVLYFDFDDANLTSRADSQLRIVANILKRDINRKIRITGHTDAMGSDQYNSELSNKRAEAIRQGIIDRGANPDQVITEGYGKTRPRKPNFNEDGTDNPIGRTENRRAEVYLDF